MQSGPKGLRTMRATTRSGTLLTKATKRSGPRTSIEIFNPDEKNFKQLTNNETRSTSSQPKLLTRVQELRLLSKAEEAGLLSAAEKAGVTLAAIEKYGLLTKAENLGLISAAVDRNTPGLVNGLAWALFAAGPAVVYFVPDATPTQVAIQVAVSLVCILGGSAAFGAASLLKKLQEATD